MARAAAAHAAHHLTPAVDRVWKRLKENSLSIVFLLLFLGCLGGQLATGLRVYNDEAAEHGEAAIGVVAYVTSGHFLEATFENWESEFLQMALFVVLTASLFQKGSAESKKLTGSEPSDQDPRRHRRDPRAPWPVKKGGVWLALYERSLSIVLGLLFVGSFVAHALGGIGEYNAQRLQHGEPAANVFEYVRSAQFWFESLQNWQSEFLAVLAVVTLSIVLRQRGSPQSKPVAAPHDETG